MPRLPTSPFRRVRTPLLIQQEPVGCGPAALWVILGYYGKFVPLEDLRDLLDSSRDGTRLTHLIKAASHFGLESKIYRKSIEGLAALETPFIAHWGFNHFVVVEGFGRNVVYLNDPTIGRRSVSYEELNLRFTGIVAVFSPSGNFRPGGDRFAGWTFLRRKSQEFKAALLVPLLLSLLIPIPTIIISLLIRQFLDLYIQQSSSATTGTLLPGIGLAALTQVVTVYAQQRLLAKLERQLSTEWSEATFWKLLHLPITYHIHRGSSAPLEMVSRNEEVAHFLTNDVPLGITNLEALLGIGLLLFLWSPTIAISGFVFVILAAVFKIITHKTDEEQRGRLLVETSRLANSQASVLDNINDVKLSGNLSNAFSRTTGLHAHLLNARTKHSFLPQILRALSSLTTGSAIAVCLAIGAFEVICGTLTIGTLIVSYSLLIFCLSLVPPLVSLFLRSRDIGHVLSHLQYLEAYNVPPFPSETSKEGKIGSPDCWPPKQLDVKSVTFGYSRLDSPLVKDLSFTIQPGQHVALVGANGSGKSTVARLIAQIYTPWEGELLWDNKVLLQEVLTTTLGLAGNDGLLFTGTLRENITLGDTNIDEVDLHKALTDACLDDLLLRDGGWDTPIEANGANLSGGQRQRLEIARALAHSPSFLILDEATNALDPITEGHLLQNLRHRDCTCLIISHRLSSIRDCDEILVMEEGRIVQQGTHDYLSSISGQYRELLGSSNASDHRDHPMRVAAPSNNSATVTLINEQPELASGNLLARHNGFIFRLVSRGHSSKNILSLSSSQTAGLSITSDENLGSIEVPPGRAWMRYPIFPKANLTVRELCWFGLLKARQTIVIIGAMAFLKTIPFFVTCFAVYLLISYTIPLGNSLGVFLLGLLMMVGAFAGGLFQLVNRMAFSQLQTRWELYALAAAWDRLLHAPGSLFRRSTSSVLNRQLNTILSSAPALQESALTTWTTIIKIVMGIGITWLIAPPMALAALALLLPSVAVAAWQAKLQFQRGTVLEQEVDIEESSASQIFAGLLSLRLSRRELYAWQWWKDKFEQRHRTTAGIKNSTFRYFAFYSLWELVLPGIFLALAAFAPFQPEVLVLLYIIFLYAQTGITEWRAALLKATAARVSLQQSLPILQSPSEETINQAPPCILRGEIEFRHVSFRYDESQPSALDDFSFHIKAGEFIGIIGASGAGKSTLLRLALGLERPDQGSILYDGEDLLNLQIDPLRHQIGTLLQNSKLIPGDIASNILGASGLQLKHAWQAAEQVGIAEDIKRMPMGMQTFVSDGGINLSGSQRQLLLLARTLVTNPSMLFLDESTAYLDSDRSRNLIHLIESLPLTRIVITHRVSTIRHADHIIVLSKGRIIQSGDFTGLMKEQGPFLQIAQKQLFNAFSKIIP